MIIQTTHFDPVESGAICHTECAVHEIQRLRELVKYYERRTEELLRRIADGRDLA
jgi:hypothetical protein